MCPTANKRVLCSFTKVLWYWVVSRGEGGQSLPFSRLLSNLFRLGPLQPTETILSSSPVSSTQPNAVLNSQPSPCGLTAGLAQWITPPPGATSSLAPQTPPSPGFLLLTGSNSQPSLLVAYLPDFHRLVRPRLPVSLCSLIWWHHPVSKT